MYGNVGLPTPRGSGTNGYVVRNLSFIRQRRDVVPYETLEESKSKASSLLNRQPNQEILNHEKKRKVEIECLNFRQQLEEMGKSEEEIEEKVNKLRQKLLSSLDTMKDDKNIQEHQVHQLSKAKATENERMMKALGIKPNEYVEGAAFDRELQEQNKRDRAIQKALEIEKRQKKIEEDRIAELLGKKEDRKHDDVRQRNPYPPIKKEEKKSHGRDYEGNNRKNRRRDAESNSESSDDSSSSSSSTESDDSDSDTDHRLKNYESKGRSSRYEDRNAAVRKRNNNESRNDREGGYRRTDRRLPRSPRRHQSPIPRRHRDASIPTPRRHRDGSSSPIPGRNRESASPYSRRNRDNSFSPPRRRQRDYSPKEDYNYRRKVPSYKRSLSPPSPHRRYGKSESHNATSYSEAISSSRDKSPRKQNVEIEKSESLRSLKQYRNNEADDRSPPRDRISQRRAEESSRYHRNRSSDVDSSSEVDERKNSIYKRKRRDDTSDSELDSHRNRRHQKNRGSISSNSSDSPVPEERNKHPQLLLPEHLQRKKRRGGGSVSSSSSSHD